MNINEAKSEILRALKAYTAKSGFGTYLIPQRRQRPVLLMGPPGIGKTAIMEQIARQSGTGLVSYTMTHHTRQSAIGLPILEKREYFGREYTVTEYTMSEIIASVYSQAESFAEGILFLDEINCVSETLMPAMLQFLQYKSFGGHSLPEGWMIVAAGNPARYNQWVRELDAVTLDRLKVIDIEPELSVWRQYAVSEGIHPAVLSYLSFKPESFYSVDGDSIVTARGWEDLSVMLTVLETCGEGGDAALFSQYLRNTRICAEFAAYYESFRKLLDRLELDGIFESGRALPELKQLAFDEKLCVIELCLSRLNYEQRRLGELYEKAEAIVNFSENAASKSGALEEVSRELLGNRSRALEIRKKHGLLRSGEEDFELSLQDRIRELVLSSGNALRLRELAGDELKACERLREKLTGMTLNALAFIDGSFGRSQEELIFLSGLCSNPALKELLVQSEYNYMLSYLDADMRADKLRQRMLEEESQENGRISGKGAP